MTQEKMEELAKAAAHSAAIARHAETGSDERTIVDTFINAYEYAMQQLYEKQIKASQENTQTLDRYHAIKEGTAPFKHGRRL